MEDKGALIVCKSHFWPTSGDPLQAARVDARPSMRNVVNHRTVYFFYSFF